MLRLIVFARGKDRPRGPLTAAFIAFWLLSGLIGSTPVFGAAGSISGVVEYQPSDSAPSGLAGIEVCAYALSTDEKKCALTADGYGGTMPGEYVIAGLSSGVYKVEFWSPDPLGYIPEYFDGKSTWSEANEVVVSEGLETPGIDANLEGGGWIQGFALDETTFQGIAGVLVCAFPIDEQGFGRCGLTGPGGEYILLGLATDLYEVAFLPEEGEGDALHYLSEFYDGKSSWVEATPVEVTAEHGTVGIHARLGLIPSSPGPTTNLPSAIAAPPMVIPPASHIAPERTKKRCRKKGRSSRRSHRPRCAKRHRRR